MRVRNLEVDLSMDGTPRSAEWYGCGRCVMMTGFIWKEGFVGTFAQGRETWFATFNPSKGVGVKRSDYRYANEAMCGCRDELQIIAPEHTSPLLKEFWLPLEEDVRADILKFKPTQLCKELLLCFYTQSARDGESIKKRILQVEMPSVTHQKLSHWKFGTKDYGAAIHYKFSLKGIDFDFEEFLIDMTTNECE